MDEMGYPDPAAPGRRLLGLLAARIVEDGSPAGFDGALCLGVDGEPPLWLLVEVYKTGPTALRFVEGGPAPADNVLRGSAGAWEAAFAGQAADPPLSGRGNGTLIERVFKRFTETKNWLSIRVGD